MAKRSAPAAEESAELALDSKGNPLLKSSAFYVANQATGEVLLEKNGGAVVPIASITKLMTAMVVLEASPSLSEELSIDEEDIDQLKGTGSRLSLGTRMTREELLRLALMSSENRAASTLARHYPGGLPAFVNAMNIKARLLSMTDTRFHDSTGLNPANVSSPRDLARLVAAASRYPLIREFSTTAERYVEVRGRQLRFGNTNSLVKNPDWEISVSKTGYISEAGRCLVMQAWINQQPVVIVLMDSVGRYTRTADAQRVRKWIDSRAAERVAAAPKAKQG
ncbi:MAG: D-alanyl-D-alanine endopeptidase [Betaproteobacteria bacterium HGW-Betaproteobacteria-13]|nr:MAG: D-alanyl-D-alanine endopeptidase [Betaproteobacteria bacterium HGW-Betaproteobacteria-13]